MNVSKRVSNVSKRGRLLERFKTSQKRHMDRGRRLRSGSTHRDKEATTTQQREFIALNYRVMFTILKDESESVGVRLRERECVCMCVCHSMRARVSVRLKETEIDSKQ